MYMKYKQHSKVTEEDLSVDMNLPLLFYTTHDIIFACPMGDRQSRSALFGLSFLREGQDEGK